MNDAGASKAALQTTQPTRVLVLSGGVGGAKLALGLARVLPPGTLTIIANTGDDFEHFGLHVSPDIDTLTYALADLQNEETGWGRREWSFMTALKQLGVRRGSNLVTAILPSTSSGRDACARGSFCRQLPRISSGRWGYRAGYFR